MKPKHPPQVSVLIRYIICVVSLLFGIGRFFTGDTMTGMDLLMIAVLICPAWDNLE